MFDVVDLYRRNDEIHRERIEQGRREIKHFLIITRVLKE